MDHFTWAVIVGDVAMAIAFVALIVLDKPRKVAPIEPAKTAGKRPA